MSISITTLNDGTANQTFSEIKKDTSMSMWINTTRSTGDLEATITIRQALQKGKNRVGTFAGVRRTSVSSACKAWTDIAYNPQGAKAEEAQTVTVTINRAPGSTNLDVGLLEKQITELKNFFTTANTQALARGEL